MTAESVPVQPRTKPVRVFQASAEELEAMAREKSAVLRRTVQIAEVVELLLAERKAAAK